MLRLIGHLAIFFLSIFQFVHLNSFLILDMPVNVNIKGKYVWRFDNCPKKYLKATPNFILYPSFNMLYYTSLKFYPVYQPLAFQF